MSPLWLLTTILALAIVGFLLGRARAISSVDSQRTLQSRPTCSGVNVAMLALVPAVLVPGASLVIQPLVVNQAVSELIPASSYDDAGGLNLIMPDVQRVADGLGTAVSAGVLTETEARALDTGTTDVRALLGEVGAVLLAASRAIGETMIMVLGAGAAAGLSLNPFDAMTTVTAKIVSQLTGDREFASPEALVAFTLGMTLFLVTLGLNVAALYIMRRYREQYE